MAMKGSSLVGAVVLIALGGLFLYANLDPDFNPWPLLARYWPLLIILWGVNKLVNYLRSRDNPQAAAAARLTFGDVFFLILLLCFGALFTAAVQRGPWSWEPGEPGQFHQTYSEEMGDAEAVEARIELRAGTLRLEGGAANLLEADFDYDREDLKPRVSYRIFDKRGKLTIVQPRRTIEFGESNSQWELRFSNDIPLDLNVEMGAGRGLLRLAGLNLTNLDFEIGVGSVTVDLSGDWKQDLDVRIRGGVGQATIRLPREVGVRVRVRGGLGSIDVGEGLTRRGNAYVNDAYGKSPVTLRLEVAGGIGTIRLETW